jgi:hypothetical protein
MSRGRMASGSIFERDLCPRSGGVTRQLWQRRVGPCECHSGASVKFVLYEGFGRPITEPKEQCASTQENWNWFAHYIWGDPFPGDLNSATESPITTVVSRQWL